MSVLECTHDVVKTPGELLFVYSPRRQVEQISALSSFIEAEMNYHRQTADSLEALHVNLQDRIVEATNRPR